MPFQSKAQMRFMYSQHPEIAEHWQKETPNAKSLPAKKKSKTYSKDAISRAKIMRGI